MVQSSHVDQIWSDAKRYKKICDMDIYGRYGWIFFCRGSRIEANIDTLNFHQTGESPVPWLIPQHNESELQQAIELAWISNRMRRIDFNHFRNHPPEMLDMSKSGDWKTSVRSGGIFIVGNPYISVREIGKKSVSRSNRSRECNWLVPSGKLT